MHVSQAIEIGSSEALSCTPAPTGVLQHIWNTPRILWCLALIPHTVAILLSMRFIAHNHSLTGPGNLGHFLEAARAMSAGREIYSGKPGTYVYPPLLAFLYQPLGRLTNNHAGFISLAINGAVSIFTLVLVSNVLVRRLTDKVDPRLAARVALFGALCIADKIKGEFSQLETNVFMLLAFTAAMRWVDKRPWLCGLALGFAFNIKYLPLVLMPYLLLRRRWSAVGWFIFFAIAFALLPALSMGWHDNLAAWSEASGGIFKLFGFHIQQRHVAPVLPITTDTSISLSSGIARITQLPGTLPLVVAAMIGAVFCGIAAFVYLRNRVPIFLWPSVDQQAHPPFRGLLSIEWMTMLLLTLIFSPFTNSRHLYMLMDVYIACGVLLFGTHGKVTRKPLAVAAIVCALGITFPPGGTRFFDGADHFWRFTSGGAWCMLGLCATLLWTNVKYQRAAFALGAALGPGEDKYERPTSNVQRPTPK